MAGLGQRSEPIGSSSDHIRMPAIYAAYTGYDEIGRPVSVSAELPWPR